jgi:hypothetical protein
MAAPASIAMKIPTTNCDTFRSPASCCVQPGLKTDAVEVTLLPGNDMSEERRKDYKLIALGALDIYSCSGS